MWQQGLLRSAVVFLVCVSGISDASAFWWLFRAATVRPAVGVAARAGVGATSAGVGGLHAESAIVGASRFCVRPVGAVACDFRAATSGSEAANRAVGPGYRVRATNQTSIFEVLDAAGNVVSILQSVGTHEDASIASVPQYQPQVNTPQNYEGQGAQVRVVPLRHNGDILNFHVNGTPTHVWSDGYMEVWADHHDNRIVLPPGQRLHFANHNTIHAIPRSSDAYTFFGQASGFPRSQGALPQPMGIFPYGSSVSCPQVPIGNGMARCQ